MELINKLTYLIYITSRLEWWILAKLTTLWLWEKKKKKKRQKKEKIWTLGHICDFNLVGILRIFFIPPPSWEDTDSTIKAQKSYITNT